MGNKKTWKEKLISSSFPLEYEASKILVKNDFIVDNDYTYSREDNGIEKDFSVDIHASAYIPYTNENKIESSISMLIECKQRKDSVNWLFLSDINKDELSCFTLGNTIHSIDNFSYDFFNSKVTSKFDENIDLCLKGTEIDVFDGRVYDSEIRHGLFQLQYAMPRLIKENIEFNNSIHKEEIIPFFIGSILLTTSKLYVTKKSFSIDTVRKSDSLEDFADEVPYLITYLDDTPEHKRHIKNTFMDFDIDFSEISQFREDNGEYSFCLPNRIINSLKYGYSLNYFSQILVCNMEHFDSLLKEIKKVTSNLTRYKKDFHH